MSAVDLVAHASVGFSNSTMYAPGQKDRREGREERNERKM